MTIKLDIVSFMVVLTYAAALVYGGALEFTNTVIIWTLGALGVAAVRWAWAAIRAKLGK